MRNTMILGLIAVAFGLVAIGTGYAWSVGRQGGLLAAAIGAIIFGLVFAVFAVSAARTQR
ncbi:MULTISPECIES: hypothetical protein [unclassified Curtobacterium]|uniref:hypothetical protein n=1 Tax=unclassified Curtobacterium TaxID=257496 RepID=UPI0021D835C4|nr:hypothetical protein [Curtobacterium sp. RIT-PI-V]